MNRCRIPIRGFHINGTERGISMKIEDFLELHIERYLFNDLENMSNIKVSEGNASYPMVISTISGMEFLGYLLQSENNKSDCNDFYYYYDNCLSKCNSKY